MDIKRILTTVIGIPLVILVLLFGNKYVIGIITLALSILCMDEYFKVIKKVSKPIEWVGYLSNIFIILAMFKSLNEIANIVVFIIPIIMLILFLQVIITNMKTNFKDVSYTLLGILYIPFFLMFFELIRAMEKGNIFIGYVLIIAWSTDIFAYLIGKHFGKHKFCKISPKKSLEGSIAGIVGSMAITIIYTFIINKYCGMDFSYYYMLIISLVLSIVSQVGDIVASSIKRFVDVKDYGNLIPGHGGMLDRFDSVLFLLPFCYLAFLFI